MTVSTWLAKIPGVPRTVGLDAPVNGFSFRTSDNPFDASPFRETNPFDGGSPFSGESPFVNGNPFGDGSPFQGGDPFQGNNPFGNGEFNPFAYNMPFQGMEHFFGAFFVGMLVFWLIVTLAISILGIICLWRLFKKAGQPGWKSLIPIYNTYVMLRIAGCPGWWLWLYFVPYVNLVVPILAADAFVKAYGRMGLGPVLMYIFLSPFYLPYLAFSRNVQYVGPFPWGSGFYGGPANMSGDPFGPGYQPGAYPQGGYQPGGHPSGSDYPGGSYPGGSYLGGSYPGGNGQAAFQPAGNQPTDYQQTGYQQTGYEPAVFQPGGYTPAGYQQGVPATQANQASQPAATPDDAEDKP